MHEQQTEVLVVGAGPVGLLTALVLTGSGVDTRVIDRESRTTSRSYACALHPATLELLERLDLLPALLKTGRKVQRMAFYDGAERRAEVDLARLQAKHPYLLILPQGDLEDALEERLKKSGVTVAWNNRFDDFHPNQDGLHVTVEKLGGTATGYIVPHWETIVEQRFDLRTKILIGADGYNSLVRNRLGVDLKRLQGPEFFAAYEFDADTPSEAEVRVVLDDNTTNVLWPLQGNRCRWTFQLTRETLPADFPEKERRSLQVDSQAVDEEVRKYVQRVAAHRAPWFSAAVKRVTWCTDVVFEHRLAAAFGNDRCWLAGDAAHQTGPVGAQSMNVGLLEADALARQVSKVLRENASIATLQEFNTARQAEWAALLGIEGGLKPRAGTSEWVRKRFPRLLSCLPASGPGLQKLADQLGLDFVG